METAATGQKPLGFFKSLYGRNPKPSSFGSFWPISEAAALTVPGSG